MLVAFAAAIEIFDELSPNPFVKSIARPRPLESMHRSVFQSLLQFDHGNTDVNDANM